MLTGRVVPLPRQVHVQRRAAQRYRLRLLYLQMGDTWTTAWVQGCEPGWNCLGWGNTVQACRQGVCWGTCDLQYMAHFIFVLLPQRHEGPPHTD